MRIRDAAAWLVAPALLVAVASIQWWRVERHDQSTWAGVGFGMFATFENDTNRFVAATVELDGETATVVFPTDLATDAADLRIRPSKAATRDLADEVARRRWAPRPDGTAVEDDGGTRPERATVVVGGVAVDHGDDPSIRLIEVRRAEAGAP